MRYRACVCGKRIPWSQSLCAQCADEYGRDRDSWPAWLLQQVRDVQAEIDAARRHDELWLDDETGAPCPTDTCWAERYADALRNADPVVVAWAEENPPGSGPEGPFGGPYLGEGRITEDEILAQESAAEIVNQLSRTEARVLLLSLLGLDQQRIADVLGCTQQAVSKALAAVREIAEDIL